jgi:PTS system fructose-specific IIC component
MGTMGVFDFGGPVNEVVSLFADGLLLQGICGSEAIKICASMIPPFGVTLSWLMHYKKLSHSCRKIIQSLQMRQCLFHYYMYR